MGIFGGPKQTSTQNQTQSQTGTQSQQGTTATQSTGSQNGTQSGQQSQQGAFSQSTTPNLPAWYQSFLSSIPGQFQGLAQTLQQNASTPLYGPQQQANFQNQLAHSQATAGQTLQSQLASSGALNSGRAAQMQTQLALGGQSQLSNYLSQVPQENAAYQTSQLGALSSLLGQQAGFTSPVSAFGSTTAGTNQSTSLSNLITQLLSNNSATGQTSSNGTSTSNGTSSGNTTQQTQPNILGGLLSGALGAGVNWLSK